MEATKKKIGLSIDNEILIQMKKKIKKQKMKMSNYIELLMERDLGVETK